MDFLLGTISGDLMEVPGIGPKTAEKLAEWSDGERVTNTYQLIGKVCTIMRNGRFSCCGFCAISLLNIHFCFHSFIMAI